MIIACPECQTRYVVSPAAIGEEGRRVQCSRCRAVWFEGPVPEGTEVVPEQVIQPRDNLHTATHEGDEGASATAPGGEGETEEGPLGIFGEDFRSNVPALVEGGKRAVVIGWALLAVFVFGLAGSAYFFRGWLEDHSDAAAMLYQKWDARVLGEKPKLAAPAKPATIVEAHPSSYLVLRQSPQIQFEGEAASLVVAIEIRNSASFDIRLPPLQGVIRDASGVEIYSWVQPVDRTVVPANGVLQFEAKVENIPAESAEAELAFVWRR